jgi:hypothetical protein
MSVAAMVHCKREVSDRYKWKSGSCGRFDQAEFPRSVASRGTQPTATLDLLPKVIAETQSLKERRYPIAVLVR